MNFENFVEFFKKINFYKELILSLVYNEIKSKYKGSFLGVFWILILPVATLLTYTFVFGNIFKARWGSTFSSTTDFALILFIGLIVFNFVSENLSKSPSIILNNPNYVKKVVFPIEMLSLATMVVALFNAFVSFLIWFVFYFILYGVPSINVFFLPIIIFPLSMMMLGVNWFLSAIGVYVRDIGQIIGVLMSLLLFLTPIFYPISAIPQEYRLYMYMNPMTQVIEELRNILFFNTSPDLLKTIIFWAGSSIVMGLGYRFFQKTKKGFADVL